MLSLTSSNVRRLSQFPVYHLIRVVQCLQPQLKGSTESILSRVSGTAGSIDCQVGLENIATRPDRVYVKQYLNVAESDRLTVGLRADPIDKFIGFDICHRKLGDLWSNPLHITRFDAIFKLNSLLRKISLYPYILLNSFILFKNIICIQKRDFRSCLYNTKHMCFI